MKRSLPAPPQAGDMVAALAARMSNTSAIGPARQYAGYRLVDFIADRSNIRSRDPHEILHRSTMGTSDFPLLLASAANKVLLDAYRTAPPVYRAVAERRAFNDFKVHSFLRASDFPALLPLGEGGLIQHGSFNESREQLALTTNARAVRMTRQMIINDDLGAFGDLARGAGRAAANVEARLFSAMLSQNSGGGPTMSDGLPMFHASHGNLAPSGTAIDRDNVGKARAALRKQKNLDGDFINPTASILLTGPDKETEAEAFLTVTQPVQTDQVNPFARRMSPVTDARLGGNAWYVFADLQRDGANFAYGYLGGDDAPRLNQETGFTYDGVGFSVVHDFAIGAVDYRFGYRNAGA